MVCSVRYILGVVVRRLILITLLALCVNTAWAQSWFGLNLENDTLNSVKRMLEKEGVDYEISNIEGDKDMLAIYAKNFKRTNMRNQTGHVTFRFLAVQKKEGKTEPLLSRITVEHDDPSLVLFEHLVRKFELLGYDKRQPNKHEYHFQDDSLDFRIGVFNRKEPGTTLLTVVSQELIAGEMIIENAIKDAKATEFVKSMFG